MILSASDFSPGWHALPGGSWLFRGARFQDERGSSVELTDLSRWPAAIEPFILLQENLVETRLAGCARGLHYQLAPFQQAKLVTVLRGRAQFFWLPLNQQEDEAVVTVHSIVLDPGEATLYTPADQAHGMLALADSTEFLLKMSRPVSLPHRGEINLVSRSLTIDFAGRLTLDLLSDRDRRAPEWHARRRA